VCEWNSGKYLEWNGDYLLSLNVVYCVFDMICGVVVVSVDFVGFGICFGEPSNLQ